ncbi:hypothetical protein J4479_04420 [Candidatus Woesearchaeota archaeon]|nr:hypothetical protein [Candidatus Woesearchaeota archaeon]
MMIPEPLKRLMKLTEPELEELKSLRAALTKIKKGDAKVLAIRDLLDGNLSNILSVAHLMKVRSENDSRDLDTYLWGMFHKNLVKDALDSLYLLSEEGSFPADLIKIAIKTLEKYK